MSTSQQAPKESIMQKVEGFFGIKKSADHIDNAHVQADAEAAHRAELVSEKGIPQPVPTAVLRDIEHQHGSVPHAHHVNVIEHSSVPLGHVQKDPTILDKMSVAFKNMTTSHNNTTTATPEAHTTVAVHDKIPHAALPDSTLKEIKSASGAVPHAHHVDLAQVEHSSVPLGHVLKDPTMLDKMSAKIKDMTSSSSASTSTSTSSTSTAAHDNIPHAALPDAALKEIKSAAGTVPHAHHVDLAQVEHSSVPLGHVVKDPTMLDKMSAKIKDMTTPSTTAATTSTINTLPARDNIPHSSLPNSTLKEIQSASGSVPHAHHVDVTQSEHSSVPLGHVVADPTLLDKMSAKIKDMTAPSTSTSTSTASVAAHDNIPHAALPDSTLKEIKSAAGSVPHAHHVDLALVEHSSVPLGHVVKDPTMLDKMSAKIKNMTTPSTTANTSSTINTLPARDNIPHSSLPNDVLKQVQKQDGKPEHVHHVDIAAIEREHEPAGLGHVVAEPSLLDKAKDAAIQVSDKMMGTSAPVTHANVPQASLGPAVMKDVRQQHGNVPNAHHVNVIEHINAPVGKVVEKSD